MSCIYKITVGEKEYIGSTNDYERRMRRHKSDPYNIKYKGYNYKINQAIRENDGKYKSELIYLLQEGENIFIVEQVYYDLISPELNMHRPYRSEEITKKCQEAKRRRVICECGISSQMSHLARHRKTKIHQDLISQKIII